MDDERFDLTDPLAARLRAWFAEGAPTTDAVSIARHAWGGGVQSRPSRPLAMASAVAAVVLFAVVVGLGLSRLWEREPSIGTESPAPSVAPTNGPTQSPAASPAVTIERPLLLGRSVPGGGDEIFLADWDGDIGENLTNHPAQDHPGEISPDGRTMVFISNREGDNDVYLMDLATRAVSRLTSDPADDWNPVWAPDGSRIAFFRAASGMNPTIYLIGVDGAGEIAVTDGSVAANHVDWSTDGTSLRVWMVSDDGDFDIFRMQPDGTELEAITDTPGDEGAGAYSPDGSLIAFSYAEQGGQRDIWGMGADGGERRQLTDDPEEDWTTEPVWSPDGQQIIYQRGARGDYFVIGLDGSGPEQLFEAP